MDYLDHILLVFVAYYLAIAPYTKVEESFNLQAVHDQIYHGYDTTKFDHIEFPGVVPRSFVGAIFISSLSKPFLLVDMQKSVMQVIVRGILGLINVLVLIQFKGAVKRLYGAKRGSQVATWFIVLLLGQFHILFYISRTLPNMFAFPLVVISYVWVLDYEYAAALRLLAFTAVVFRSELAILCGCTALVLLFNRKLSIGSVILAGIIGGVSGVLTSLAFDSYFWGFPSFPELQGVIFNVVNGKSSEWGTEPWDAYFTKHLPNIMGPLTLLFALVAMRVTPKNLQILGLACFAYVAIYSLQPHKELRFVIYVSPVFTALGARGIDYLHFAQAKKSVVIRIGYFFVMLSTAAYILSALVKLHISAANYPGGEAIEWFNNNARPNTTVHMDVLACMTGVTRFQYRPEFSYDKTETQQELTALWNSFDYIITSNPSLAPTDWTLIKSIRSFSGINLHGAITLIKSGQLVQEAQRVLQNPLAIKSVISDLWSHVIDLADALYIYERVN